MGAGYARSRPRVHPHILAAAMQALGRTDPWQRALDVGCGAGLSTWALDGFARQRIGLEPATPMLPWAAEVSPQAMFLAGAAEAIPIRSGAVDLITAAGSLNYVSSLARFFDEADRVLSPEGMVLVYDFSPGRRFEDSALLERWSEEFTTRYPKPRAEATPLSPPVLAAIDARFCSIAAREFTVALTLSPAFYVDYAMTETNVSAAVRRGTPEAEIRSWCEETLSPVWGGVPHQVLFDCYFACLSRCATQ